jgi:glucan phosphorylase
VPSSIDTNVGTHPDRLSARLYGSDPDLALQEILIGIGGVRALRNLGHNLRLAHE